MTICETWRNYTSDKRKRGVFIAELNSVYEKYFSQPVFWAPKIVCARCSMKFADGHIRNRFKSTTKEREEEEDIDNEEPLNTLASSGESNADNQDEVQQPAKKTRR